MHDSECKPVRPIGNTELQQEGIGKEGTGEAGKGKDGHEGQEGQEGKEGQDRKEERNKGHQEEEGKVQGISWHSRMEQVLATDRSAAAAAEVEDDIGDEGLETAGAEVISEEVEEEELGEAKGTAVAPRPHEPTLEEIHRHVDNQHIPYRNWCE